MLAILSGQKQTSQIPEIPIKAKRSSSDSAIHQIHELWKKNEETHSLLRRLVKPLDPHMGSNSVDKKIATISKEPINRNGRNSPQVNNSTFWTQMSACFKGCVPSDECISRVGSCFQRCFELQGRAGLNNTGYPDYSYLGEIQKASLKPLV